MFTSAWGQQEGELKYRDYYKEPDTLMFVHKSFNDYSQLAQEITNGCSDDYEKIKAIYKWICDNIAYDTSYQIRNADECFLNKRGVCQGYSELFHYIAKSIGVRSEVVSGFSRDRHGVYSNDGHAWIFAYTRENHGILIDPTWGAGYVNGSTFTRSKYCWEWFNVEPERLILTHYPKKSSYQLIGDTISNEEFRSLPPVNNLMFEYGIPVHDIYMKARAHELDSPEFYHTGLGDIEILEMPMVSKLQIGQFYKFRIRKKSPRNFVLHSGSIFLKQQDWTDEGDGVYSINYMHRGQDFTTLALLSPDDNKWWGAVKYGLVEPTPSDWQNVEKYYPLDVPDMKNVERFQAKYWEEVGVDGHTILAAVRAGNVKRLPTLYNPENRFRIVSVPMNYVLTKGGSYTFRFIPRKGTEWAIINDGKWFREWEVSSEGVYSMTIKSAKNGNLTLLVKNPDNNRYWTVIGYEVQ